MSDRPLKPKLKEKHKSHASRGPTGLTRFMAKSSDVALVPRKPDQTIYPTSERTLAVTLGDTGADTRRTSATTKTSTTRTKTKTRVGHQAPETGEEKKRSPLFAIVLAGAVALVLWLAMSGTSTTSATTSSGAKAPIAATQSAEQRERIEFNRTLLGTKLNRDRIQVQIENAKTAPSLNVGPRAAPQAGMMSGLPLEMESHHRKGGRDRLEPVDPDYADARVRYSLQEELDARLFEDQVREQYRQEFMRNAAAAGWAVSVDERGVATVRGRLPARSGQNERKPNSTSSQPGGIR